MCPGYTPPSRYELNRCVATVMSTYSIDLQQVSISCSTTIVYLTGSLRKAPEVQSELTAAQVEDLLKNLRRIPHVRGINCDLENWDITNSDGAWEIRARKEKTRGTRSSHSVSHEK